MSGTDLDRNKLGLTSEAAAHLQAFDITDQVHNDSARLYTEYISGDFLRISIPLNHPSLSDTITAPVQIEDSLVTYWGIPNASDRWGQLCVILRNVNDGSTSEFFFDSDNVPLLVRDLPYLSMDQFLIDIDLNDININGKAGDVFEVGVAASLVTKGRHNLLYSKSPQEFTWCVEPSNSIALEASNTTPGTDENISIDFSSNDGGYTTLQMQNPADTEWHSAAGWNWNTTAAGTINIHHEHYEAYACQEVLFRMEHNICGSIFYSNELSIIPNDALVSPFEEHHEFLTDKGYSDSEVNINWSVQDIDDDYAFSLERRVYEPSNGSEDNWTSIASNVTKSSSFVDQSATSNKLYEYRIKADRTCDTAGDEETVGISFTSDNQIGYRRGIGAVSGTITYGSGSGTAVEGVNVLATRLEGESLRQALNLNKQCLNVDLTKNDGESNLADLLSSTEEEMAFGFWFKVTETFEQQDGSNIAPLFAIIDSSTANDAGYSQIYALKAVENFESSSFTIYQSTGAADDPISNSEFNMNTWHHLAAHRSGETLTYYINGQQHFSKNYALVTSDNPLALIWGAGVSLTQGCLNHHATGYTTDFTSLGGAVPSPYYDVSLPELCSDNIHNQCFPESAFGEAYILRWYTDTTDAVPIIGDSPDATNNTFTLNTPTTLEPYTIYDFSFTANSGSYAISSTKPEWSGAMKLIKSSGEVIIPWINYDPDSQNEYEFSVGDASIDEFSCDDNTTPWSGEHLHDALPNTDPNFGSPLSAQLTGPQHCVIPFAPADDWTVTTWFKLSEPLSGNSIMSCKGHELSAKNGFLHIGDSNTYIPISSSIWHFISLSSDGELRVYNTATDIHSVNADPDARPHVFSSNSIDQDDSGVIFFTDINTTLQSCFGWNRILPEEEITSVFEGVDANEFDGSENEINTDINFANGLVFAVGASTDGIQNRIDGTTLLGDNLVTLLQRGHSENWIGGCYNDPNACNYNPLADAWGKCYYNCNPSIPSTSTTFDAGGIQLDEIQVWSDSASVHLYRTKYPSYNTPGLVAYWECDESAGVHAYDRSLTTPNGDDNQGSGRGDFNGLDGDILSVVCENVTLYSESFDAFEDGYGIGQGGVPNGYGPENQEWTLTTSTNSLNYASVVADGQGNHVFSTQTKTALVTWESPTISINGYDNLTFSVDLSEDGPHESEDYIQVYARYNDSNSATLLGEQTGNFNSFELTYNLDLDGNESVQFLIKMYNTGDDEILTFDNLMLSTCPDSETEEGQLGNFQTADGANSTSFFTQNIATAINLQGTSDSSGVYSIRNIKYQGSGDLFAFSPSFGVHTFEPTSRSALIGDALSTINNIDFVDISYFDYEITVLYQEIDSVSQTYPEEASGQGQSGCGVPGVSFYIDGIIATSDEGIIETDAQGKATIQIGVGQHTLTASKANNTFKEESKNIFSINNSEENFICTTTRKATGRILGGFAEAALEWNASYGNMGIANLVVIPAESQHQTHHIDDDVHDNCPSVKITTDSLGQYEVNLLPLNYHAPTNPTFPDYPDYNIELETGLGYTESSGAWDMEDAVDTYDDGKVFDNSAYGGSNDCPQCVDPSSHLRVDVLYIKDPVAMAYQGVYDADSETCTATPLLIDFEEEIIYSFIGEDTATFSLYLGQIPVALDSAYIHFYNTNKYQAYTDRYTEDEQPYPFGKPVLYPMTPYCLAIEQQEIYQNSERTSRYSSAVEEDNVNIELAGELSLLGYTTGPSFNDPSTETLLAVLMSDNPDYESYGDEANDVPTTSFSLQVNTGDNWTTWQPQPEVAALIKHYEDQFEDEDYNWSVADDIGIWGDVRNDFFDAQIFGTAYAGDDMPISTNPELMFILRDPPGDASSTTLEQGSTVAQEISYESSNGLDHMFNTTWSWGTKARVTTCVGAVAVQTCTESSNIDVDAGVTVEENWSQESSQNNTKSNEFSFEESISTSGDDDNGDLGYNQDIYYGTTENITISNTGIFMYMDAGSQAHISEIGSTSDTEGSFYTIDLQSNLDGTTFTGPNRSIVDAFTEAGHDITVIESLSPIWAESVNITPTIDSYFMKTQFTLETIDLPALESIRNDEFQTALSQEHITLGTYFDHEEVWKAHCGCEEESEHPMYGTNNDDPRWYWYYDETPSSNSWRNFESELDKSGPSYIVDDTAADYGDDDTQDPIWEANINLISWKLMLAQNELDKLNARTNLNVSDFQNASLADDIADNYQDLTDQGVVYGDLENIYQFLGYADENSGQSDNYTDRLWSWSDWQDFSISASGGGAEYSQTLTSTTTKTKARSASASSSSSLTGFNNWTYSSFTKSEFETQASIGYTAVYTSEASASKETSLSYSYSISDDDAKDFFLVYVTPGEGMDSPIFLTLGGAASCPRVIEETSVYAEYYRMLSPQESFDYSDESNGKMGRNEDGDCIAESTSYKLTYTRDDGSESDPIPFLTRDAADEWAVSFNLDENDYDVKIETTATEGFKILKDLCDQLEDEKNTEFAIQPELLLIDSVDLSISTVGTNTSLVTGVPADEALVVDLILQNRSPISAVNDYVVYVDPTSNSDGHSIEFSSGGSTASFLQVGHFEDEGNIEFTATITSNGTTGQNENDIIFIAQSQCDDDVVDDVVLTHEFAPACTELTLQTPTENWYAYGVSTEEFYTVSSSSLAGTDGMSIEFEIKSPNLRNYVNVHVNSIDDYGEGLILPDSYVINSTEDEENDGHAAVFLEYRLEGELNWTPLEGWTADYIENVLSTSAGATQILSLDENNKLETETRGKEAAVELRLRTFCNEDFILHTYSETVSGTIDRIAPSLFGRPLPLDHVLQEDDEIKFRFTEPINQTQFSPDDIKISGTLNTDPQANSGGLAFTGEEHLTLLDAPSLVNRDWLMSMNFYLDLDTTATLPSGTLFSQSVNGITIEASMNSGNLTLSAREEGATPIETTFESADSLLHGLWNELLVEGKRDADNTQIDVTINSSYLMSLNITIPEFNGSCNLRFGNSEEGDQPFSAVIQDIRLWNPQTEATDGYDDVARYTGVVTGKETGLTAWLPLNELEGNPVEQSRGKAVTNTGQWTIPTIESKALALNGDSTVMITLNDWTPIYDATLSCWFNKTATGAMTLLSLNDPESADDVNSEHWEVGFDADGKPYFANNGIAMTAPSAISEGWHHMALARERYGSTRLLIDGQEVVAGPSENFGRLIPGNLLLLGASIDAVDATSPPTQYHCSSPFIGFVDEVRFWTAALDDNAILSMMHDEVSQQATLGWLADFETTFDLDTSSDGIALTHVLTENLSAQDSIPLQVLNINAPSELNDLSAESALVQSDHVALIQSTSTTGELNVDELCDVSWNMDGDELIIDLHEELYYEMEDQELSFSIDQSCELEDILGNSAADIHWTLTVDLFPLAWEHNEIEAESTLGEDLMWTTTLFNTGSSTESFEITDGPAWLDISPASGTLGPNSSQVVTFTVAEPPFIGSSSCDVRVIGDFCDPSSQETAWCYGERLTLNYKVTAEVPELNFDPTGFENVMSVTAKVYLENHAAYDEEDIICAYIDNELRGIAPCDHWISNQALAFLSVFYSESDASKTMDFKIWDASRGIMVSSPMTYWPDIQGGATEVLVRDEGWGTVFEPLILQMGRVVDVPVDLVAGWNWISLPFNHPDHTASEGWTEWQVDDVFGDLRDNVIQAKSAQQDWAVETYDASNDWGVHQDTPLALNFTYQVKLAEDASVVWTGRIPESIDSTAYPVYKGWNDVGFPSQRILSIEDVMYRLYDSDVLELNDHIKGRYDGFATYIGNGEWAGTLSHLEPTRGYRMYLQGMEEMEDGDTLGTLVLPQASLFLGNPSLLNLESDFETPQTMLANVETMEHSMVSIATLALPTHWIRSPLDRIEWWAEGRMIGYGRPALDDDGERYYVHGFGEHTGFKTDIEILYVSGTTGQTHRSIDKVSFEANGQLGTFKDPVMWRFHEEEVESTAALLNVIPNPFSASFELLYSGDTPLKRLTLIDTRGRIISERRGIEGVKRYEWNTANLENGMYFIQVIDTMGEIQRVPLIKQ